MLGIFGDITSPFANLAPGKYTGTTGEGLILLLTNFIKLIIVAAGVYAFFNLLMGGWGFISAGSDPKNITKAWEKIWQSVLGLVIVAGSFVLAVIIGYLIYGSVNADILIRPLIFGP
ncbi:hypothetical protein A3H89_02025 [Candidatus Amesbacteria bacterium RIFCSPLOWO2_02_FULL_48_11]|nr:MAG: hypothetical protein A2V48_03505 [Candidatus Amesbacteria bacterium RBG_19FT_COMBO_48_16]OGC95186.1 MAG: hypothetical protein A3C34_01525 [Candidatus Amesbacteria bacterium RIFCSPHIGHO2_02_FULL_48_21]OGD06158.1 MAG: hypothetical protein A3H89_02025 [Candidatus Amesbacteria bacterium RIFCSPLOWO2_02_FULL_48_11]